LKSEVRILASSCVEGICTGFVVRGDGIDGVVIGTGCTGLCLRLSERGFLGELRYSVGDCTCGLPEPPRLTRPVILYRELARKVSLRVKDLADKARSFNSYNV
jgi:hypothetical protein